MSRLEINASNRADLVMDQLYRDMERRIESAPLGQCPVDMTKAFLETCIAQSCGKCVPCRIGLRQLKNLLEDVLEGRATMDTLDLMEETATAIMETADCAIGFEAAAMVYKGLKGFRDEFISHIENKRCSCGFRQPVPCVSACPAGVDIPGYIALINEGRFADAVKLIRKDNPFPTVCGLICEHPCEAKCRRGMLDDAVNIRGLKRMATEFAGEVNPPVCGPSTGKSIAIVGGGPTGLAAAYFLQLMGHKAVVFEGNDKPGGMLRYGIPSYRLPKDRLDEDIKAILDTGVELRCSTRVGKDVSVKELRDCYDAVLITIGAGTDKKLGIEGEDAEGIMSAVTFLKENNCGGNIDLTGKKVCVVGGGNVSMDAVRTAVRAGAERVSIVYRRRTQDMTALKQEIESAAEEGVEMLTLKAPSKIEKNEDGSLKGLWVKPQMISSIKNGRASVKATGEEDYMIPCDLLVVAIGQDIEAEAFRAEGIPVTDRNLIQSDKAGATEGIPGVFTGGDCATGPATVIKGIAAAKALAANVDEYLGFHHEITSDVELPPINIADRTPCARVNMVERPSSERKADFEGVELPMSHAECQQEAGRCLRCDRFGYGSFRGGRTISW